MKSFANKWFLFLFDIKKRNIEKCFLQYNKADEVVNVYSVNFTILIFYTHIKLLHLQGPLYRRRGMSKNIHLSEKAIAERKESYNLRFTVGYKSEMYFH